ncbi:probable leucine carboxyl methyltransferase 2 [Rhynchosporium graminicola]|uniref:tRNA wybutosine-synthesizing protein 4 n=1 Tax=Rhynchosporium graminicola TaxID=2792576 RepID=A0A1E1L1A2_9HELO|nr:probable leucine carboxyl methyltransferase 2 [Rhynchosporium commune]
MPSASLPMMKPAREPETGRSAAKSKSQLQDDSIMGTNNSSIVSKRSVERLYFPDEAHFFRYFVKKPQRRSPLINRGYWVRMKAIDQVVRQFLEQDSPKQKVVVNLGCGYDPLPWQCLERYPAASNGTKFIDIDYRDLMLKKRTVVQSTNELNSMLTGAKVSENDVLFTSDQYIQLGCDLRDLQALGRVLASVIDIENCTILFTAEVSITYMNVEASDALIHWASRLTEARFCVLEQLIPDGEDHPFSRTMMAHFGKLRTVLGAVQKYPTEKAQFSRFTGLGWPKVQVCNLWKLWNSPTFATPEERTALDQVEPFDEWEEFALFGCHYFLLVADSANMATRAVASSISESQRSNNLEKSTDSTLPARSGLQPELIFSEYPKNHGYKRFAASMPVKGPDHSRDMIGVFAGMGLNTRTDSMDKYSVDEIDFQVLNPRGPAVTPSSRMCHTITDMGDTSLLVGGRTSPDNASRECWLYHKWLSTWERLDDLPWPLYRHQATRLNSEYVLVSTGRIDSRTVSTDFLVWNRRKGWVRCSSENPPRPSYGAVFFSNKIADVGDNSSSRRGFLAGGMSTSSSFLDDVWQWKLNEFNTQAPTIHFTRLPSFEDKHLVARFGANVVCIQDKFYIIGGVIKDRIIKLAEEVCVLSINSTSISVESIPLGFTPRPLLIGSTTVAFDQSLVITGGSAVCFSFGTFWNKGSYTVLLPSLEKAKSQEEMRPSEVLRLIQTVAAETPCKTTESRISTESVTLNSVPRVQIGSALEFSRMLESSTPVIIEKADIGPCTAKWTTDYLKEKIGTEREVIVHEASTEHMNFKSKNFSYVTKWFGDFLDQIQQGQMLYLRSLSAEKPSEKAADISRDFPSIAADFVLPPELAVVTENTHSSPLRISGPVNMWLHYDVMANVYCQIKGSKRLLLFPPTDVKHLGFEPGSSSSQLNVFQELHSPRLAGTHPQEALLQPGDVLFLPSLWLHAASPTSGVSIAVNVFFRSLSAGYAAGKDVYGNRDLQAYEKGRIDIAKIVKSFENLPKDVRGFYLQRLLEELRDNI